MTDPYKVLGVARNATDEQIKKAYRVLSRKYHPDANINNPNKEKAEEMFKEVQQAYNQIVDERQRGMFSGGFDDSPYRKSATSKNENDIQLAAAASYIMNHYYQEALNVLNHMSDKSAEWYYLAAVAESRIGRDAAAFEHAKMASEMDPDNQRYAMLVEQLEYSGGWYKSKQQEYGMPINSLNRYCTELTICGTICGLYYGLACNPLQPLCR